MCFKEKSLFYFHLKLKILKGQKKHFLWVFFRWLFLGGFFIAHPAPRCGWCGSWPDPPPSCTRCAWARPPVRSARPSTLRTCSTWGRTPACGTGSSSCSWTAGWWRAALWADSTRIRPAWALRRDSGHRRSILKVRNLALFFLVSCSGSLFDLVIWYFFHLRVSYLT